MSAAVYFFAGLAVLCGVLGGLAQIGEKIDGAFLISGLLGAIGGALVAIAQRHLVRSRQMLREADEIRAAAHREFERWRKASEALERQCGELKFGAAVAGFANLDPFKRPPGCLCREVLGGDLKIEDYCPAHNPPWEHRE